MNLRVLSMKNLLRKLCMPILRPLEAGDAEYVYKASHRKILLAVGALFMVLSLVSAGASLYTASIDGLFPCIIFLLVSLVCMLVSYLGSDRAVAKIWGSK
jgi:hypothetical protein